MQGQHGQRETKGRVALGPQPSREDFNSQGSWGLQTLHLLTSSFVKSCPYVQCTDRPKAGDGREAGAALKPMARSLAKLTGSGFRERPCPTVDRAQGKTCGQPRPPTHTSHTRAQGWEDGWAVVRSHKRPGSSPSPGSGGSQL